LRALTSGASVVSFDTNVADCCSSLTSLPSAGTLRITEGRGVFVCSLAALLNAIHGAHRLTGYRGAGWVGLFCRNGALQSRHSLDHVARIAIRPSTRVWAVSPTQVNRCLPTSNASKQRAIQVTSFARDGGRSGSVLTDRPYLLAITERPRAYLPLEPLPSVFLK
jgi:hypothetical protein